MFDQTLMKNKGKFLKKMTKKEREMLYPTLMKNKGKFLKKLTKQ